MLRWFFISFSTTRTSARLSGCFKGNKHYTYSGFTEQNPFWWRLWDAVRSSGTRTNSNVSVLILSYHRWDSRHLSQDCFTDIICTDTQLYPALLTLMVLSGFGRVLGPDSVEISSFWWVNNRTGSSWHTLTSCAVQSLYEQDHRTSLDYLP